MGFPQRRGSEAVRDIQSADPEQLAIDFEE